MKTFLGLGHDYVSFHHALTGSSVYLNLRRIPIPVSDFFDKLFAMSGFYDHHFRFQKIPPAMKIRRSLN